MFLIPKCDPSFIIRVIGQWTGGVSWKSIPVAYVLRSLRGEISGKSGSCSMGCAFAGGERGFKSISVTLLSCCVSLKGSLTCGAR